ncbi:hypothetical protein FA13DRAFT_1722652 [Coprinellus micaceus]|uniref:Uncharacterized protein n=1 Tax=Coprinellus micaceus TaxID=71717 RepID=A0A4Y7RJ44_COPMI|nr:hypothetical protein FA13DRAFT_1722652 [Coprinellus micaceus]
MQEVLNASVACFYKTAVIDVPATLSTPHCPTRSQSHTPAFAIEAFPQPCDTQRRKDPGVGRWGALAGLREPATAAVGSGVRKEWGRQAPDRQAGSEYGDGGWIVSAGPPRRAVRGEKRNEEATTTEGNKKVHQKGEYPRTTGSMICVRVKVTLLWKTSAITKAKKWLGFQPQEAQIAAQSLVPQNPNSLGYPCERQIEVGEVGSEPEDPESQGDPKEARLGSPLWNGISRGNPNAWVSPVLILSSEREPEGGKGLYASMDLQVRALPLATSRYRE